MKNRIISLPERSGLSFYFMNESLKVSQRSVHVSELLNRTNVGKNMNQSINRTIAFPRGSGMSFHAMMESFNRCIVTAVRKPVKVPPIERDR